jgi:hypothetical protein
VPAATPEATRPVERVALGALPVDRLLWLAPHLVTALAVVLALRRLDNTDTWTILAAGRWIVEHGTIPATDTLSYTATDRPWINVQWLFYAVLYLLHQAGGPTLLVLSSALVYGLAVAVLMRSIRRYLGPLAATLLGLWVVIISQERFAIRPEMMSYLLVGIILSLYASAPTSRGRNLWWLPLVMIVWVNSHAVFIIGAIVIGAHMAAAVAGRVVPALRSPAWSDDDTFRLVLVTGAASLVVLLVNPFGLTGALFPLELMSWVRGANTAFRSIGELKPPFSGYFVTLSVSAYQIFFVASIVVILLAAVLPARRRIPAGAARAARRRAGDKTPLPAAPAPVMPHAPDASLDLAGLMVFAALAYLSLQARRNMAIFAFGAAPLVARSLAGLAARAPDRIRVLALRLVPAAALLVLPAAVAAGWFVASNGYYRWNGEQHEFGGGILSNYFPIRAAEFVREHELPTPMFNDFTSGGYLAWSRPVPGGVYIDGRAEYGVEFYTSYIDNLREPKRWQEEVDRRGIQSVLFFHRWPNHRPLLLWLLSDQRWAVLYYDEVAVVAVRKAGHEALAASARASFDARRAALEDELLAPSRSWQWPVARYQGLVAYGALLDAMGRAADAIRFYERVVDLRPAAALELPMRLRLARYHADQRNLNTARLHLARIVSLDPDNPAVAELRRKIGDQ